MSHLIFFVLSSDLLVLEFDLLDLGLLDLFFFPTSTTIFVPAYSFAPLGFFLFYYSFFLVLTFLFLFCLRLTFVFEQVDFGQQNRAYILERMGNILVKLL